MKPAVALLALVLAACALGPQAKPVAVYDFGMPPPAAPAARIAGPLRVADVAAPAWLDSPAIVYRLAYQDPARREVYSLSRWAGTPAALLTQRLRTRLAAATMGGVLGAGDGARSAYTLVVELDDFSHVFDTVEASRGVVRVRATLIATVQRTLVAQHSFSAERSAAGANAQGGVSALVQASDELIEQVLAWTAQHAAGR